MKNFIRLSLVIITFIGYGYSFFIGKIFEESFVYILLSVFFLYAVIFPFIDKKDIYFVNSITRNSGKAEDAITRILLLSFCAFGYAACIYKIVT